ncbi:lipid A core-O-antigen ligase-like enyme [Pleurocapsa sp. PCC 7327]|uniref:O-antigen ligase family protein n=1 Tax=Pleurocapsa sp. PCC 7327 TaxID=118163 RepID=UPI00029FB29F|nr:O-antigen ligase family protein [Pleurocapsa sp. PCC 7327]AFY76048.1 lipid A core-O-antigen ligase-like enyme [Pleurocapsa sp. PCC 7327]
MDINVSTSDPSPLSLTWRGQWLGWLGLAILVFFTWLPYSYELMVSSPWIAIWQLGFLLLGVWAIWMLRQFQLPFKPLGHGLDWALGLIAIALFLSTLFCQFRQLALWNVSLVVGYGLLLYILRNWLGNGGLTITRLWIGVSLIGVVTSIISLIVWYPEWASGAPRNQFPMGHPNFVAGYLLLILPLTIALALSRQGWQRIGALAASLPLGVVLYTTSSRGGFLGLLILGLMGMVLFTVRGRGKQRWQRLAGCSALLILIAFILLSNPRVRQIVQVPSIASHSPAVQVRIDGESRDRIFMWQASLNIFKAKPLFGVGPGNMARVYNLYRPIEVGTGASHVQQLHNTPLQILGELGLVGFSAFLFLIGCLGYLWYKLYKKLSKPNERYLLYGIGGGLLAYGASSLTDYQLENIAISGSLVVLIVMLVGLADDFQLSQLNKLRSSRRRWLSLGGITVLVLIFLLWFPVTWAMKLASEADSLFIRGNLEKAYNQLSIATNLVPWDPIYNLLTGFQLLQVREGIKDAQLSKELSEMILQQFQKAVDAAPYDAYFNHNLGLLYHEQNQSDRAQIYLSRATQLLPRLSYYTYYLLGLEYLKQQETEKAINALALSGLINPEILTREIWNQSPLVSLKDSVVEKTISFSKNIWTQLSTNAPEYNQIYENIVLLQWWERKPIKNLDFNRLQPVSQALLLAENSSQKALNILNKNLEFNPKSRVLLLLRAWLEPQQYLNSYLENASDLNAEEQKQVREHIFEQRNLRSWLSSVRQKSQAVYRNALTLPYRNLKASEVAFGLSSQEEDVNLLVLMLGLFPDYPQVLLPLDRLINQIRTEQLNLPHPIDNNFQLETKIVGNRRY